MTVPTVVKRIVEAYRGKPGERTWADFMADPAPELNDLQAVLAWLQEGGMSPQEQALVDRIEQRRSELRQGDDQIEYRDFGAGMPDSPRAEQQLRDGVVSDRRVADLVLASIPRQWGLLLFGLVRRFQPLYALELGSALGISGSYLTAALAANDKGHLFTLEGCPQMAERARHSLSLINANRATLTVGRFQDTLADTLDRIGLVDFTFVDGHHDGEATIAYWLQIAEYLTPRSIVVFDDIDWSDGMGQAWEQIKADSKVCCSIDLGKFGCCLCRDGWFDCPRHFTLDFPVG